MTTVSMPSAACPAPPAVSLTVADGWDLRLAAGSLIHLAYAADPETGWLSVRHLVLAEPALSDQVIEGLRAVTTESGGVADEPFALTIGDRTATAVNLADSAVAGGSAAVHVAGFFAPGDESAGESASESGSESDDESGSPAPVSGLYVIGTVAGPDREERYADVRDMILSLSLGRLEEVSS